MSDAVRIDEILYDESRAVLRLSVTGSLNTENSTEFRRRLIAVSASKPRLERVLMNLDGLSYASSMGIGSMVEFMTELRGKKAALDFVNVPPQVRSVMDLLGFSPFLSFIEEER